MHIHNYMDQSKAHVADVRHRLVLHNSFGIYLCEQQFGDTFTNSVGKVVSVRDVAEDHVLQDLGFIPTLDRCLSAVDLKSVPWAGGTTRRKPKKLIDFTKLPEQKGSIKYAPNGEIYDD